MAQQVTTTFVDDLDGSAAEGTVAFSIDGRMYDIDLSEANASRLRDALAPYVVAARRAGGAPRIGSTPRRRTATSTADREQSQAIREWAESQGLSIATRGRISSGVMEAYRNRHAKPATPEAELVAEDQPLEEPVAEEPVKKPRGGGRRRA